MATQTMTSTDVSSASAVALAAASAVRPLKHRPSPLPTPQSATFPSSLQSPLPSASRLGSAGLGSATFLRPDRAVKTPLTPPSEYLAFLNQVNKAKSPLGSCTSFTFSANTEPKSPYPWPPKQPASARPSLNTQESTESNGSNSSHITTTSDLSTASAPPKPLARRASDPTDPKPDPQRPASTSQLPSRPHPAIRRPSLMIPESPSTCSPSLITPESTTKSALGGVSPASATAAKNYYLGLSPMTDAGDKSALSAGGTRPFRVRHIITRTVTYTRPARTSVTPTGPLPKATGYAARATHPGKEALRPSTSGSDEDGKTKMSLDYVLSTNEHIGSAPSPDHGERKHKTPDQELETEKVDQEMGNAVPRAQSVSRPTEEAWGQPPKIPLIGEAPKGKRRKIE